MVDGKDGHLGGHLGVQYLIVDGKNGHLGVPYLMEDDGRLGGHQAVQQLVEGV